MRILITLATLLVTAALGPSSVQGQAVEFRENLTTRSLAASRPVGLAADDNTARRRSAMGTGAKIGLSVGMVAGVVIWASRKCDGFGCTAKLATFPMTLMACSAFGLIVGAGMGYVVGSTQQGDYRQLPRTPSMSQFRIGVALAF
jgi:hypothetical protein